MVRVLRTLALPGAAALSCATCNCNLLYVSGRKRLTRTLRALLRRRSALGPVSGHLKQVKQGHGLGRKHLLGRAGDRINALLKGCGFNLRKLWHLFKAAASR